MSVWSLSHSSVTATGNGHTCYQESGLRTRQPGPQVGQGRLRGTQIPVGHATMAGVFRKFAGEVTVPQPPHQETF